MIDALIYLSFCILGYVIAIPCRKISGRLGWVGKVETFATLFLILSMGIRVGSSEEVIHNLGTYGMYSLVFTLIILVFSIIFSSIARRILGFDKYGNKKDLKSNEISRNMGKSEDDNTEFTASPIDRTTLLMIACVTIGIIIGYLVYKFTGADPDAFGQTMGKVIMFGLCLLLLMIGFDMGLEKDRFVNVKSVGIIAFVLPISIAVGTLIGSVLCSFILPLSIKESLAVGAGFGWYSLSSGIIMDAGLMTAGTISFMHNVMREIIAIILIPFVSKKIGYFESVSLPGSPSMDVCLPVITQSTNANVAICSFINGFILSMLVPILVPLFL